MANVSRKKKFSINFELSPSGLLGVGVVCFCIFLWMFLLGVWAGQTILTTGSYQLVGLGKGILASRPEGARAKGTVKVPAPIAQAEVPAGDGNRPALAAKPGKVDKPPPQPALAGVDDAAYFAVQVGAFRESAHAEKSLKEWQAKGYQPFSRPPEGPDDHFTRVYVGRFEEIAAARKQADTLEQKEKLKPFIATIPAGSGNRP